MIFDIQNYCLYDGPGIRTCVYFKGCPLHCAWCHNPESIRTDPQMAYSRDRCRACGSCVKACKKSALRMEGNLIRRDLDSCEACGRCEEVCPNEAMERIGYQVSANELAARLEADIPFFKDSGGGVTITGGEPTFQANFLFELLDRLRERGIHSCVETCGQFDGRIVNKLVGEIDIFLFDLKHMDSDMHRRATGVGNQRILLNFSRILDRVGAKRIIPRIPLIPGFNTDPGAIDAFIMFLESCGYKGPVHLMPYHEWARAKYERIGLGDAERAFPNGEYIDRERTVGEFKRRGFVTSWGG